MDRDGYTVVPETNAAQVTALAGERTDEKAGQVGQQGRPKPGENAGSTRRSTFRALHSKPFRLYFAGQVASASGTFLQQTAMGWLVLRLTGSGAATGAGRGAGGGRSA